MLQINCTQLLKEIQPQQPQQQQQQQLSPITSPTVIQQQPSPIIPPTVIQFCKYITNEELVERKYSATTPLAEFFLTNPSISTMVANHPAYPSLKVLDSSNNFVNSTEIHNQTYMFTDLTSKRIQQIIAYLAMQSLLSTHHRCEDRKSLYLIGLKGVNHVTSTESLEYLLSYSKQVLLRDQVIAYALQYAADNKEHAIEDVILTLCVTKHLVYVAQLYFEQYVAPFNEDLFNLVNTSIEHTYTAIQEYWDYNLATRPKKYIDMLGGSANADHLTKPYLFAENVVSIGLHDGKLSRLDILTPRSEVTSTSQEDNLYYVIYNTAILTHRILVERCSNTLINESEDPKDPKDEPKQARAILTLLKTKYTITLPQNTVVNINLLIDLDDLVICKSNMPGVLPDLRRILVRTKQQTTFKSSNLFFAYYKEEQQQQQQQQIGSFQRHQLFIPTRLTLKTLLKFYPEQLKDYKTEYLAMHKNIMFSQVDSHLHTIQNFKILNDYQYTAQMIKPIDNEVLVTQGTLLGISLVTMDQVLQSFNLAEIGSSMNFTKYEYLIPLNLIPNY